ncbi:MAG TPA: DUF6379 domain-containing protein [Microbacterium sp.]|uniref:C-glycoside deglycosidase beta subunit domain-containing protein n=1 Tax=Microbacterium sp. TaxID=51671 RepID=UPI002CB53F34|nr:DUF6379 domain-containing protein [Microbacterium sp.]HWI30752.1 DUF6379 domain-containing protein [Microbacterium sp.]
MLAAEIIENDTLRVRDTTVAIDVRMPWYRALPLSSIAEASLSIDGSVVDPDTVTWTVNGVTRPLAELAELWDENWYVLDSATIAGTLPADIEPGREVTRQVDVALSLYIPYLPNAAHGVLRIREQDTKSMTLKELP